MNEKAVLLRMGIVRVPSSAIAAARVKIKRALRKAGIETKPDAPTSELIRKLTDLRKKNPEIHVDIGSHNTSGKNVRAKNPRGRSKRPTQSLHKTASWVVRAKSTGKVLFETYDKKIVASLNNDKYEAVPILKYLASLNKSRSTNPRGRSKRPVTRVSQATGKRPTARLVKRRKATQRAPKGYFANPLPAFTHVIEESQPGSRPGNATWKMVGVFKTREEAIQYGRARADASKQVVRYRKI